MAQVLKNYKVKKGGFEEFKSIKFLDSEDVIVELPIAVCEYNKEYEDPVLVPTTGVFPVVHELKDLKEKIKGTRVFHLIKNKKGKLVEVDSEDKADASVRLDENVDLSTLTIEEGQVKRKPPKTPEKVSKEKEE